MSKGELEIAFSRAQKAGWPPLHAKELGEEQTLCGIPVTEEWGFDSDCTVPRDVECERCLSSLKHLRALPEA